MGNNLAIKLTTGDTIEIDEADWQRLASSTHSGLQDEGNYNTETVVVYRHDDGRQLVFVSLESDADPGQNARIGEMLPDGSDDVVPALMRLGQRTPVPMHCVESCVQQIQQMGQR